MIDKRAFLMTLFAGHGWAASPTAHPTTGLRSLGDDPDMLQGATAWLNSPPLTRKDLRGKVVLVDFWTYSCINWRREYPFVRAWAAKYRDLGLVVIGVHTPEFSFEKDIANVKRAVQEIGVSYPVAVDSERRIWRAFRNAYWPALYFIDARGMLRHHQFGEGAYDTSERVIQQLLKETGLTGIPSDLVAPVATGAEAQPDWENLQSPETYLGFGRSHGLVSAGATPNKRRAYEAPPNILLNQWALAGDWTLHDEAALLDKANGRIVFSFHARDLHLVMGPATGRGSIGFKVTIDGKRPGPARGVDVDALGLGVITQHRMYQLIRQPMPIAPRRFEIQFLDPQAEVYAFTFG
ncbi:MAG: thioredoxin family protein [Burkholderiaceae bacterium]|nr:thioredoxin family protein [Burkholderiaceae bacterium]